MLRNSRPLHILEEGKKKNDGMARKMPQPFLQFLYRKVGQVRDIKPSLVGSEPRLRECCDTLVKSGLPGDDEDLACFRQQPEGSIQCFSGIKLEPRPVDR